jgi:PAX-interacting protein 1
MKKGVGWSLNSNISYFLNLFFVDIEPGEKKKEIYNIKALQNKIEPSWVNKNNIVQCTRCQQYGHTKSYSSKRFICVRCGGSHNSNECKESKKTLAKFALCGGNHSANYKGCEFYHNLIKGNNKFKNITQRTLPVSTNIYRNNIQNSINLQQQRSYTEVTKSNTNKFEGTAIMLTKVLNSFTYLFSQFLQQNSMILNMLTMLNN